MLKLRRASHYALIAFLGGVLFTWGAYAAGIGVSLFFGPVIPVLRVLGYIPEAQPTVEPGELPFSVYEAFIAFFSAVVFWVLVVPVIVWLLTTFYLRAGNRGKRTTDA